MRNETLLQRIYDLWIYVDNFKEDDSDKHVTLCMFEVRLIFRDYTYLDSSITIKVSLILKNKYDI